MGALERYHVILAIAEEATGKYPQGAVLGVFAVADDLSTYHRPSDEDAREAAGKLIQAMVAGDVAQVSALLRPATDFWYAQQLTTDGDKKFAKVCNKARTSKKATDLGALAPCLFEPRLHDLLANSTAVLDVYNPDGWRALKADEHVGKKNADLFMKTTQYVFTSDLRGDDVRAELLLVLTTHPSHGTVVVGVFGKVVSDG